MPVSNPERHTGASSLWAMKFVFEFLEPIDSSFRIKSIMTLNRLFQCTVLALLGSTSTLVAGEKYKIESVFSSVLFKVRHMQTANAWGRFNEIAGLLDYDAADPTKSKLELTINPSSIDTNSEKRDEHLVGPDFFNAKEFDKITFKSTSIKKVGEKDYELTGDLTMLGVTKTVTAKGEFYGEGKSPKGDKIVGAEATFKVKRTDFGMNYGVPNIGDEVTLIVSVEALEAK
jgi:polyisoprenoid-binding protein YceI